VARVRAAPIAAPATKPCASRRWKPANTHRSEVRCEVVFRCGKSCSKCAQFIVFRRKMKREYSPIRENEKVDTELARRSSKEYNLRLTNDNLLVTLVFSWTHYLIFPIRRHQAHIKWRRFRLRFLAMPRGFSFQNFINPMQRTLAASGFFVTHRASTRSSLRISGLMNAMRSRLETPRPCHQAP
jgi:hypothetical protein